MGLSLAAHRFGGSVDGEYPGRFAGLLGSGDAHQSAQLRNSQLARRGLREQPEAVRLRLIGVG